MRLWTALVSFATLACSAAPTGTNPPPPPPAAVATVTVTPIAQTLGIGGNIQLAARLKSADGTVLTGRMVSWTSSDPGVAPVSSAGVVSGVTGGGPVNITATSDGESGTSVITVTGGDGGGGGGGGAAARGH